jgi:hypothetical protein
MTMLREGFGLWGDSAAAADPGSVKNIIAKLQGRHLLSDGRPVMISVLDLAPQATRNPGTVVNALSNKRPMLLMWNSHLYVLYGALFDEAHYADGTLADSINQLFLLDPVTPIPGEKCHSRATRTIGIK